MKDLVLERVRAHHIDDGVAVIVRQSGVGEQPATAIADDLQALAVVDSVSLEFELPSLKWRRARDAA